MRNTEVMCSSLTRERLGRCGGSSVAGGDDAALPEDELELLLLLHSVSISSCPSSCSPSPSPSSFEETRVLQASNAIGPHWLRRARAHQLALQGQGKDMQ